MEIVKYILLSDGIWENIGGHVREKEEYKPDDTWLYVIGVVNGSPIGLVLVHKTEEGHDQCHVQILPEHRKEQGKEFGIKGMKWIWDNTDIERLVASIPAIYPNVRRYAEMQGFQVFRTLEKSYKKDDIMHDRWLMAVRREEWAQQTI